MTNLGFFVNYGKSFLKTFAMSSRRNSILHAYVKCSIVRADKQILKISFRSLNSMIQLNIVLCIIELSYLQYSMSRDVKDSISPLVIEESTSYMDVPKLFLTWWLRRSMVSIPMRSEFLLWNIMNVRLSSIPGKK